MHLPPPRYRADADPPLSHATFPDLPGPEVTAEAVRVLKTISAKTDLELDIESHHFGGAGIDNHGDPCPESTLNACKNANAVLLGEFARWVLQVE